MGTKSVAKSPSLAYQVDQATQPLCPPLLHLTLGISNSMTLFALLADAPFTIQVQQSKIRRGEIIQNKDPIQDGRHSQSYFTLTNIIKINHTEWENKKSHFYSVTQSLGIQDSQV